MNTRTIKTVRASHIFEALRELNALRGFSMHSIGFSYYADIKGNGQNMRRIYTIINSGGGVTNSGLTGKTMRETLQNIRDVIETEKPRVAVELRPASRIAQCNELRALADLIDQFNPISVAFFGSDLDAERIDGWADPYGFVDAIGGADDMEAREGFPAYLCDALRKFLATRAARMILDSGMVAMQWEDLQESQGLDHSFVWTPETLWPYVLDEARARCAEGLSA